jgi:hypothetical protein
MLATAEVDQNGCCGSIALWYIVIQRKHLCDTVNGCRVNVCVEIACFYLELQAPDQELMTVLAHCAWQLAGLVMN